MKPTAMISFVASALLVAGCTTLQQVDASKDRLNSSARAIIGTSLVGARGRTPEDQDKIDTTAARLCGATVWKPAECQRHGEESRK